jgi:O-antigen ligase
MVARPHAHDRISTALAGVATACVAIVPLAVMPDLLDRFHVIKESVMRAEAILGAFLLVVAVTLSSARLREVLRERVLLAVTVAGVAWTGLTALLSTHRALSNDSFVSVLTSALLFLVVWYAAPRISLAIFDVLVPVVMINAALAAVQEYAIYDPFLHDDPDLAQHLKATGLIDNPNVVGSFMALAAVILAVAAVRVRGLRRWLYVLGALCATASVLVSLTRTALIALAAGVVLLAIGRSVRRAVAVLVAAGLLFGAGVAFRVPLVRNVLELPRLAREGGLEVASSGRVAPALAAWEMFRDRPLTGVGPGAYRYWFTEYKTRVLEQYGAAVQGTTPTSFGDAHNDHVQLLAEVGLPGYLLFLAFLVALWLAVRRGEGDDTRQRLARALVVPLGGAFLLLSFAQFPLHLAVTRHLLVTFAGLAIGWSRPWE